MGKKHEKLVIAQRITAVILSAGSSSRMGECKALLPLDGKTALAQSVDRLRRGGVKNIWVVTGAREAMVSVEARRLSCSVVHNPNYVEGKFSSIRAAFSVCATESDAVLLLPGDFPLIKPQTVRALLRGYEKNSKLVYPTFLKERGYPLLIGKSFFPMIQRFTKDKGLRAFLAKKYDDCSVEVPVADRGILLDMDTPEDYLGLGEYQKWEHIPDRQECSALLQLAGTPQSVVRHERMVAQVALTIALELRQAGHSVNLHLLQAACLLHDIAKKHPNHEILGARWLFEHGFPEVAELVALHKDLRRSSKELAEAELLYLADKMVSGETFLPLNVRIQRIKERLPQGNSGRDNTKQRIERAMEVQKQVEKIVGKPLLEILNGKSLPPGFWKWLPRNDLVVPAHF